MNGLAQDGLFCLATGVIATAALVVADMVRKEPTPVEPNLRIGLSSTNDYFVVKVRSGEQAASVIFRLNANEFKSVEMTNYIDQTFTPQGWVPLPGIPGTWISTAGTISVTNLGNAIP